MATSIRKAFALRNVVAPHPTRKEKPLADLHIIISDVDDPHALAEALAGEGDDTSPALAIEAVIRELGDEFGGAEFNEYAVDGVSNWL